jgi:hypothetical protein
MIDENTNYRDSITQLRNQIKLSGRPARDLDGILHEIEVPLWSISLNVGLLEKINRAVGKTQAKSQLELDRLLGDI